MYLEMRLMTVAMDAIFELQQRDLSWSEKRDAANGSNLRQRCRSTWTFLPHKKQAVLTFFGPYVALHIRSSKWKGYFGNNCACGEEHSTVVVGSAEASRFACSPNPQNLKSPLEFPKLENNARERSTHLQCEKKYDVPCP